MNYLEFLIQKFYFHTTKFALNNESQVISIMAALNKKKTIGRYNFCNQPTRIELIKKKIGFNVRLFTEHNINNLSNGQLKKIYYEISL